MRISKTDKYDKLKVAPVPFSILWAKTRFPNRQRTRIVVLRGQHEWLTRNREEESDTAESGQYQSIAQWRQVPVRGGW